MSNVKHTKGPWVIKHSESKPAFNVIGTVLGGKYKIARCPYVVTNGMYPETDEREKAEGLANAHLIAAAPDLLEAAKEIIRVEEKIQSNFPTEYMDKLKNAIAKAEGE